MKIVVADDSKFARYTLISALENLFGKDIEILQAVNGSEAVELYASSAPDAVFLDLTMPVMSGFEALERIMAHDKEAVVIVVTADIQAQARERVLGLGAKVMVTKPVKEETLAALITDFVRGR